LLDLPIDQIYSILMFIYGVRSHGVGPL